MIHEPRHEKTMVLMVVRSRNANLDTDEFLSENAPSFA